MPEYTELNAAVCIADYAADEHPYEKDPANPETIPTPEGVSLCPCPYCGAEAHIVFYTSPMRDTEKAIFGVACGGGKHKIPIAFGSPRSAAAFWADCADRAKKADEATIFVTSRK